LKRNQLYNVSRKDPTEISVGRKFAIITNGDSLFGKGLQQFKKLKKENQKLEA